MPVAPACGRVPFIRSIPVAAGLAKRLDRVVLSGRSRLGRPRRVEAPIRRFVGATALLGLVRRLVSASEETSQPRPEAFEGSHSQ